MCTCNFLYKYIDIKVQCTYFIIYNSYTRTETTFVRLFWHNKVPISTFHLYWNIPSNDMYVIHWNVKPGTPPHHSAMNDRMSVICVSGAILAAIMSLFQSSLLACFPGRLNSTGLRPLWDMTGYPDTTQGMAGGPDLLDEVRDDGVSPRSSNSKTWGQCTSKIQIKQYRPMSQKSALVSQWDTVQRTKFKLKLTVIQLVTICDCLMEPKEHYYVQKSLPLCSMSWIRWIHFTPLKPYFCNIKLSLCSSVHTL